MVPYLSPISTYLFCQIHDQNLCPAELEAVHVPSYANDCDREPSVCKLESCRNAAPCRRRAKSQVIRTLSSPLQAGVWIAKSVARTKAFWSSSFQPDLGCFQLIYWLKTVLTSLSWNQKVIKGTKRLGDTTAVYKVPSYPAAALMNVQQHPIRGHWYSATALLHSTGIKMARPFALTGFNWTTRA